MTTSTSTRTPHAGVLAYLTVTVAVLLLMMILGLAMRLVQGQWVNLAPAYFYQIMTVHGAGMVGIAGLGGAAVMWHFLSRYVSLTPGILFTNLALFLLGVVMILGAVFLGGFAAGWTFLYPLPAKAMGAWSPGAAAFFLGGLLTIGVGFLLFYLDAGRALLGKYGNLGRALGWPQLFGRDDGNAPPPTVVASTMVVIINTLGLTGGAAILVMSLINLYVPTFTIDPLLAKNLIFFFGHVFINATIYMAVIALYELLPLHTGRPWKANRVFLAAWTASTVMVVIVYPHHLLMDFAMPTWAVIMGQVVSYLSGFPVLVVTAFGALMIVYRAGMRWTLVPSLLLLSAFGWAAGSIPAIVDATIRVNLVMHNTSWVPGHFHFYLLLGVVPMVLAFLLHVNRGMAADNLIDRLAFWGFTLGSVGFIFTFLYAGSHSVPRRYAVHLPEWLPYDRIGSLFIVAVVAAMTVFTLRFLAGLRGGAGTPVATEAA